MWNASFFSRVLGARHVEALIMTMHEDNRPGRGPTSAAQTPMRTTTSTTSREAEAASDLMVAPAGWRLSWGAVFAGAMVALVAQLVLNLLGLGIGLAGTTGGTGLETIGTGFGIWWAIAGIIAAAIGGWIAGRTLGSGDRNDGMIHGLLSWAGATLVVAFLVTTAMGGAIGVGMQQQDMAGTAAGQAGGAPQQPGVTAPGTTPQSLRQPLERAAGTVSGAAIASFIALLLGAAAAAAAGRAGVSAARRALHEEG